jgi:hypothetical protein
MIQGNGWFGVVLFFVLSAVAVYLAYRTWKKR